MNRTRWLVSALALASLTLMTAPASAQTPSLSGMWDLTWSTPRGEQTFKVTLVQDGVALTGSAKGPMGEMPVKDGKVDGDKVSFVLEMAIGRPGGQARTLEQLFTGVLADGTITGEIQMPAMAGGAGGAGGRGGAGGAGRGGTSGPRTFTMKRTEG